MRFIAFIVTLLALTSRGALADVDVIEQLNKLESGYLTERESIELFSELEEGVPYEDPVDNARVIAYRCWYMVSDSADKLKEFNAYLDRAYEIVRSVKVKSIHYELQTCEAYNHYLKGDFSTAIEMAQDIIAKTKNHSVLLNIKANAHLTLSRIFMQQEQTQLAFQHAYFSYQSYKEANNAYFQGLLLRDIALIHARLYNFSLAEQQLQRALTYLKEFNEQEIYKLKSDLAYVHVSANEFEKALNIYEEMEPLVLKYEDTDGQMYLYLDMAYAAIKLNDQQKAGELAEKLRVYSTDSEYITNLRMLTLAEWYAMSGNTEFSAPLILKLQSIPKNYWSPSQYKRLLEVVLDTAKKNEDYDVIGMVYEELLALKRTRLTQVADGRLLSERLSLDLEQREGEIQRLTTLNNIKEQLITTEKEKARYQWLALVMISIFIFLIGFFAYKQVRLKDRYKLMALKDELTGMANRRAVMTFQKNILENKDRQKVSLISVDIDLFKSVNDTYGHDVGDELIKSVANVISKTIRQSDLVGRVGGEEYLVVLPDTPFDKAVDIAERVRLGVENLTHTTKKLKSTVSLGVVEIRSNESIGAANKRLDNYLYEAKNSGRNVVKAGM